jgi:purine nucleosidase
MTAPAPRTKVIIDTDTGVDDGMGLIYGLLSPELDVVAVTTSFGNVDVDKVTRNTAAILERLGSVVPLAKGAGQGLAGGVADYVPQIHGEDGFGNAFLPEPSYANLVDETAAAMTVRLAAEHPGELVWIGLGPMTNLALALLLDPALASRLTRVVWMGGAVKAPGNQTPVAEADALHDPEAVALCYKEAWDFLQIGLDVTNDTIFEATDLAAVRAASTPAAELIAAGVPLYMSFYEKIFGRYCCAMHSPLTVGVVAHPELITEEESLPMAIELTGARTRGMTIADRRPGQDRDGRAWGSDPRIRVAFDVDRATFVRRFVERITSAGSTVV